MLLFPFSAVLCYPCSSASALLYRDALVEFLRAVVQLATVKVLVRASDVTVCSISNVSRGKTAETSGVSDQLQNLKV
jgi:hypothetical protein